MIYIYINPLRQIILTLEVCSAMVVPPAKSLATTLPMSNWCVSYNKVKTRIKHNSHAQTKTQHILQFLNKSFFVYLPPDMFDNYPCSSCYIIHSYYYFKIKLTQEIISKTKFQMAFFNVILKQIRFSVVFCCTTFQTPFSNYNVRIYNLSNISGCFLLHHQQTNESLILNHLKLDTTS